MQELLESLHPLERKILPYLQSTNSLKDLIEKSKLKEVEVLRALQWLENKKVITVQRSTKEIISIDKNGLIYLKKGLPEKRFLESIKNSPLTLKEIQSKTSLDQNELSISIGSLKKKKAISLKDKASITEEGKKLKELPEELFLKNLPKETKNLKKEEITVYNELSSRKELIKTDLIKEVNFSLTNLGKEISKHKLNENLIESLNTKVLLSKEWKNKNFRRYDIQTQAPKIYPGKRHFSNQAFKYIKRIWLDLGFKEMQGPLIQSSFWNFDALFTAQDHPVRELHDTFFIDYPNKADLPDKKLVSKVKEMHESGKLVKSKGWQYSWNPEEAKRLVLRTHTTCLSAKTLSELKSSEIPAKFFSVGKVFRNETLDWSHLFEFTHTEGIVIDENANLQHLIGYLKEFFNKMGFEKIRVRPGYFPYVEPGIEVDVYHPLRKKWIELGGAGILRPEVVVPLLGKDIPVLAWGLGVDRIIVDYYDIKDLRDLYKNDIKKLREAKAWLR